MCLTSEYSWSLLCVCISHTFFKLDWSKMENQSLMGRTGKDVVWQVRFLWQKNLTSAVVFSVLNGVLHLESLVLTFCANFSSWFFFPGTFSSFHRLVFTDWVLKDSLGPILKFRFSRVKWEEPVSCLSGSFSSQLQKI